MTNTMTKQEVSGEFENVLDTLKKLYVAQGGLSGKYPSRQAVLDTARWRAKDLLEKYGEL
jgi:hypothetical protein